VSIREQIAHLEELATIDTDIRRIEEELAKQKGNLEGMRSEVKGLEERLKTDRDRLADVEKTRGELQVELRQMTQQVERSREKLQRSRNERESNAAQRELEELRKLQRDREEEIEKLTSLADAARSAIEQSDSKRGSLSDVLEGSVQGVTSAVAELEQEKEGRMGERSKLVPKLPTVVYRRYESIRTRRPYAIAKTHDGTCLGCHIAIPPMMFQKMLRQEEFEQCPNCRRILYYTPAPPRDAASGGTPPPPSRGA
jgi:predicted  nucleic acid-binding Zn-ribbon protein